MRVFGKYMSRHSDAPTSLQGHIVHDRKALKYTSDRVHELQTKINDLEAEIKKCVHRHQIRHKLDLQEQIAALHTEIGTLQSDQAVETFDKRVIPFLNEQDRCRDVYRMEDRVGKPAEAPVPAPTHAATKSTNPAHRMLSLVRRRARTDQLADDGTGPAKTRVLDDYLMVVKNQAPVLAVNNEDVCERCKEPMILELEQSILACKKCGTSRRYMDSTSNAMAYGEEVEFTQYAYQRANYFREYVTQFQYKESHQIPEADIRAVMDALWEERIYNVQDITLEKIREIVRKKHMRHVYKQITQIWVRITGNVPPRLTPKQENQLLSMFKAIQEPYERHCPPNRVNFFSYSYTLIKLLQLLGYTQYLKHFTLLKDKPKLEMMDRIWAKICADLNWQFIESNKGA